MFGKPLRYTGWYPDYNFPRLFRKDKCRHQKALVHEPLDIDGKAAYLKSDLIHYNYHSISQFVTKLNKYTSLEAQQMKQRGEKFCFHKLFAESAREFGWRFFLKYGYRDGIRGLVLSGLMAAYRFVSYAKLWEMDRKAVIEDTGSAAERNFLKCALKKLVRSARNVAADARYACAHDKATDWSIGGCARLFAKMRFWVIDKLWGSRYHGAPGVGARFCLFLCRLGFFKKRLPATPTAKKVYNPDGSFKSNFEYAEELFRGGEAVVARNQYHYKEFSLQDKIVLDLGCGDGGKTAWYSQFARSAIGVDYDVERLPRAVAFAKRKGLSDKVTFVNGSGLCIPLKDNSIDLVFMNDVMEYVPRPEAVLHEAKRVLKPGGLLAINFAGWYHRDGSHLTSWIPIPWMQLFFSEKTLIRVLKELAKDEPFIYYQFPGLKRKSLPEAIDNLGCGGLNRISIRRFKKYINGLGMETVFFWRRRLARLPVLEELLGEVICLMRKK